MSTRYIFCVILSLSLFLGTCHVATAKSVATDAEMLSQQAQEEDDLIIKSEGKSLTSSCLKPCERTMSICGSM